MQGNGLRGFLFARLCGALALGLLPGCSGGWPSVPWGTSTPPVSAKPPPLAEPLATFDWSKDLEGFLPAIDACLARTPSGPAVALLAWSAAPGRVGVRTRSADPRRWDCVARADGAAIERFEAVTPPDAHPGEASPLFSRAPLEPPSGSCYDHERAFSNDGRFLGWLSYDVCS